MKEELFRIACERNAVRRAAGLPLLDIRAAMAEEANRRAWEAYAAACREQQSEYARIQQNTFSELRRRFGEGFGLSAGGQRAINVIAAKQFEQYLASVGIQRPAVVGIGYGEQRA